MDEQPKAFISDDQGAIRYVQAFRTHWLLIAGFVAIAVISAATIAVLTPKQFRSSADLLITPIASGDETFQTLPVFRQSLDGSSSVVTAARVLNAPQVYDRAFKGLKGDAANANIDVKPLSQADIVTITSTAASAKAAAVAANAFAKAAVGVKTDAFQSAVASRIALLERQSAAIPSPQQSGNFQYVALQQQIGTLRGYVGAADPTIRVLKPASVPAGPSWPRPKLMIGAAFLAALLLGCGLAVIREIGDPRISREDELTLSHRLPILTRVPRLPRKVVNDYMLGRRQLPPEAWKAYRTLRAALANAAPGGAAPRTILVTSAVPGDGKTLTSVNLAIALASMSDQRVILVDSDFHRPTVATIFNLPARQGGFSSVLAGAEPAEAMLVPAPAHPRLQLLLAHREVGAATAWLDQRRISAMLKQLEDLADVIVIDAPPVTEVAEVVELAFAVDTVVVAVRLGHTRRDKLARLREMLARRGVSPAGFVVTTRKYNENDSSAYSYAGVAEVPPSGFESKRGSEQRAASVARQVDR